MMKTVGFVFCVIALVAAELYKKPVEKEQEPEDYMKMGRSMDTNDQDEHLPEYNKEEFRELYNGFGDMEVSTREEAVEMAEHDASYDKNTTKHSNWQCHKFTYFEMQKSRCLKKSGYDTFGLIDRCRDAKCNYRAEFGTTPCKKQVTLVKPYFYPGMGCEWEGIKCDGVKRDASAENSEKRSEIARKGCTCQTIWCLKKIRKTYEFFGRFFRGTVIIKVPCKCDCRKKVAYPYYTGGGRK